MSILRDLFGLAGAGLMGYGAWLWFEPAGFLIGGSLMLAIAVVGTVREARA